ncbi:hypothetical protein HNE05_08050 [Aquipseudomonas campi]|uniref:Uncharacterized protein n=1 Tax=Aquipseudomonas campi TaxID=2731681 RepID=A0A6M8FTF8_9GAMM|nr:hypothetical protein [Pseudomonas campi]QKE63316.1 hypothetical protein HNE05_08050 [Pseudomonas campi]
MQNIDLSLATSIVALIISLTALVRSRRAIQISKSQGDYTISPKLSLAKMELDIYDDNKDMPEFSFSAELNNHSETAIKITSISLEYGHETDKRKRLNQEILSTFYIPKNESKKFSTTSNRRTANVAFQKFNLKEVHFWITVNLKGIYGEEIKTSYYLLHQEAGTFNVFTRCPDNEHAI